MNHDDFPDWSHRAADWIKTYHGGLRSWPVGPDKTPDDLRARLPSAAPEIAEPLERIFADFDALIPGGMIHGAHPRNFGDTPAAAAPASLLADQLLAGIGSRGASWQISPVAAALEQTMIDWLLRATGLPKGWSGRIHDNAGAATLAAILTMRERALDFLGLTEGLHNAPRLRVYVSDLSRSFAGMAVRLAGIGQDNLVRIPLRNDLSMDPGALSQAVEADKAAGFLPAGVLFSAGDPSVGAFDDIPACLPIAIKRDMMTHVDALFAGAAMICPSHRPLFAGIEACDSIVLNPQSLIGAGADCAIQLMRVSSEQRQTLGWHPDDTDKPDHDASLRRSVAAMTMQDKMPALKLWFVLRAHGLGDIRERICNHVAWTAELCDALRELPGLRITSEPRLTLFSFALDAGDAATEMLLTRINAEGMVYLTPAVHRGQYVIRFACGGWATTRDDVMTVSSVLRRLT